MRCYVSVACALSVLAALSFAAPATLDQQIAVNVQDSPNGPAFRPIRNLETVANITASLVRNFDIGTLRRLCPQLFQVIDMVIQNVTSTVFRVVGRAVLQSGGLGGGDNSMRKVSVVLPTFGPIDDDDEDEEEEEEDASPVGQNLDLRVDQSTSSNLLSARFAEDITSSTTTTFAPVQSSSSSSSSDKKEESNEIESITSSPSLPETESKVRSRREAEDQDVAASGGNVPHPADDLSNFDEDADRDKRFLPFGGSVSGHAGGGSAGGSGNFLFDIIRLVAGSGATEASDEKDNAPIGAGGVAEIDVAGKGDGYTEGIPGPITRLFVLANRGLANLVQDLILRLAQTSERIVNFKARLVTSLI